MNQPTPEKRREAAKKAGETMHRRKVERDERFRQQLRDYNEGVRICREIRDNPEAADADRLRAIEWLTANVKASY